MEPKPLSPVHIRVQNFQSIEDAEIDVEGFTCITGKTNIGKSAIIRAVAGALQNAPVVGDVRKGAKFCSVTLKSGEWGFRWEKGEKGGGTYYLDGSDQILDKIGQGQIDKIAEMGFGSVKVGDETIHPWLAPQWEPLFLLNKSGPAVTDFISDVSRLSVLQDAIILSLRGKKRALDESKVRTDSLEKLRVRESAVVGLDALINIGKELDEQAESIREYERKIKVAEDLAIKIAVFQVSEKILAPIESLIITKNPPASLLEKIHQMCVHWIRCEHAAKGVMNLRKVLTVGVPVSPESEMKFLKKASKHARIFPLKDSVEKLKEVDKVKCPATDAEADLARLRLIQAHAQKIDRLRKSVQSLQGDFPGVTAPEVDSTRLVRAEQTWKKISSLREEEKALQKLLNQVNQDSVQVLAELATIPNCSSCGRPTLGSHSH